ncbi:MAG: sigma-70 family RNA polymerase sigma factor [Candidatus Hinthialibacter antarcticus]|nr:sigma-70 family RNA polymerase sigma factor [Candidatus Hinthialibacter antarcticus]
MNDVVPDETLMVRYGQGDVDAFDELFRRHRNSVYAFIQGFVYAQDQWDDLFQAVFLKVVRNRKRYQPTAKFTTWLYVIVRSVCFDAIRSQKRKPVLSLVKGPSGEMEDMTLTIASSERNPRDEAHDSRLRETLSQVIQMLPDEQREALLLKENTTMTFEEIGTMLGCPANTIKSRTHYALLAIRKQLIKRGITL